MYVISMRTEPAQLQERQNVEFYAMFLNSTNAPQSYRWLVYVYQADNLKNSFGETANILSSIPQGTNEQKALGTWPTGIGTCGNYIARAAWLDENRKATLFTRPDGRIYEFAFKVCSS
jgi:hypothetical protein